MLNGSASLLMSTSVLKALPGKLNIKRHSPSILYLAPISYLLNKKNSVFRVTCLKMLGRVGTHNFFFNIVFSGYAKHRYFFIWPYLNTLSARTNLLR